MKLTFRHSLRFLVSSIFLGGLSVSPGAEFWWNGPSGGSWATAANWSTTEGSYTPASTAPSAADDAYFNVTGVDASQLVLLGGAREVRTMTFSSAGGVTIQGSGAARMLTIGADGSLITPETSTIRLLAGSGPVTIGLPAGGSGNGIMTRIQASQTWTNDSDELFTVHNSIQSTAVGDHVLRIAGSGDTVLGTTAAVSDGTGTISITKTGSGTLTVRSNSTYTGATRIEGGTMIASVLANGGAASSIGSSSNDSSNLVFDGGTLHWTGSGNTLTERGFTLEGGGGTIRHDTAGIILRFAGVVTGAGDLTKAGAGTLALSNDANDYEGRTIVEEGRLSIRSSGALGVGGSEASGTEVRSGAFLELDPNSTGGSGENSSWSDYLTLDGGTLRNVTRNNSWTGAVQLLSDSIFEASGSTTLTVGGVVGGSGGLSKTGNGIIHLTGANTYTGVTVIEAGTLRVNTLSDGGLASGIGSSSAASSDLVFNGGTLFFSNSENVGTNRGFTLGANGGTIRKDGAIVRFGGIVTGAGDLRKTGGGTLALSNNGNDFTGRIVIAAGAVEARSAGSLGASGSAANGVLVEAGGTLRLDPDGSEGAGTDVTWNETVVLNGGNLVNARRNNQWNGGVVLGEDSTIAANTGSSLTVNSGVTEEGGSHALTTSGEGTVVFTGTNSYTGATRVAGGTLVAATAGGFNSSTQLSLEGGRFLLQADHVFNDLASISFAGGAFDANGRSETIGGPVQLSLDSSILLSGATGVLRLGASAGETWVGLLQIFGWDGLLAGGGAEQIIFGDDGDALTTAQLNQIHFVDPVGLAPGTYVGEILANGEVVPGALVPEPSAMLLAATGALAGAFRRRR